MFGRKDKPNTTLKVIGLQVLHTSLHVFQGATLAFLAQIELLPVVLMNQPHHRLTLVSVELIGYDNNRLVVFYLIEHILHILDRILLGALLSDLSIDFAATQIRTRQQDLRTVPNVIELAPTVFAFLGQQVGGGAFESLYSGLLIHTEYYRIVVSARARRVRF